MTYSESASMTHQQKFQPNFALLVGALWLGLVGQLLWMDWAQTSQVLGDSDDAMRLVEVRALLTGRGWFDLHEPRLQPPIGYDSHWSRLIDAGLAGLYFIFHTFVESALAERLMRATWPLLWLLPAIVGTASLAWRLAGRRAAVVSLFLLLFGLPAFSQFRPGRIDHHDVQISFALLTLAAAIWADRLRWAPWSAGFLSGLALAIGIESLPFIMLAGGVFVVRYVLDIKNAPTLVIYGLSASVSSAFFFIVSISPDHWMVSACDAVAINTVAPAFIGGLLLAVAGRWYVRGSPVIRCGAMLSAIALAAALFIILEPRCLAGPLAMVDPVARAIWIPNIFEMQPFIAVARIDPAIAVAIIAYPVAGLISAVVLAQNGTVRSDTGFIAAISALVIAVVMTLVAVRATPYALWFAIPFVASALLLLFARLKLLTLFSRAAIAIFFTPVLLTFGPLALVNAIGSKATMEAGSIHACLENSNYTGIAQLPQGLIAADPDFGPFLLALTPHSVLAAPYHRLSYGILTSYRTFASPPDQAREILRQSHATYVIICNLQLPGELTDAVIPGSLRAKLKVREIPDWLEQIPVAGSFAVYRYKP